ncbi:MAG: glycosyltransferase [Candidatus Erginobacter occultus]|nr:glycosyltransferase [Candidatus Erginobacter occultus]
MIKILYINPAGYIGGAEKSLLDLLDNLPPERFRTLVVLLSPGPLEDSLRSRGIDCRVIPLPPALLGLSRKSGWAPIRLLLAAPFLLPSPTGRLIRLIREEGIDIVHTNGIKAHLLGVLPALLGGRPLVWHFRDLPGRGFYRSVFGLFARLFPGRIIANSEAVTRALGNPRRARVVYNGTEIPAETGEDRRSRARRALGLGTEEIAVGTVGHFAPLKGYEDFLEAMPAVLKEVPAARFLITGEAVYPAYRDYRRRLETEAERRGLGDKLVFTGGRKDPGEILAALDIFVLPSRSEGFGRANLEAMAAGLPVVSTDVGGIPEVVIDGETGILVPPNRPAALAEAISALARDRDRRKKMGAAGQKRAGNFSIRKMTDGVVAVYDEILSNARE